MLRSSVSALMVPLNDEPVVTPVIDDDDFELGRKVYGDEPDTGLSNEFTDSGDDDLIFMLEQEFCFIGPDHTHTYLGNNVHCCKCGTAHPSIRNAGCGSR